MKKQIALFVLSALTVTTVSAQEMLFSAKLKKEEIPAVVITAQESDYPGMEITDYEAVPLEFIGEDWIVHPNTAAFANKDYDTYLITFSGDRLKGQATYDRDGNLISARERMENVPLPHYIQRAVAQSYPGWAMAMDHELLTINRKGQKRVYYRIELDKAGKTRNVVYDGNANEVKEGKVHHLG
ncbi:hypothetical protein [Flavilitoribacter nigricans]|uniref:Beta-lactamase-inhibitor-like PepSY-like domain-containing protein n=1 Tax=Flavilitoribacter nigricans (strain ATCC 23147 / DSM 23189 / NBRC 102662 / NCIMB 1420 / SS-2) TaxID=1122177 RepID=A0A2D0N4B6_FLAN2|nr:hypothetical protein [Flavilitoribacter nigricans]PHN03344.1 hypothetical protein CRP01_27045 [Flavilitoribacter nigricans DSM 23189 = NBRC 102662]